MTTSGSKSGSGKQHGSGKSRRPPSTEHERRFWAISRARATHGIGAIVPCSFCGGLSTPYDLVWCVMRRCVGSTETFRREGCDTVPVLCGTSAPKRNDVGSKWYLQADARTMAAPSPAAQGLAASYVKDPSPESVRKLGILLQHRSHLLYICCTARFLIPSPQLPLAEDSPARHEAVHADADEGPLQALRTDGAALWLTCNVHTLDQNSKWHQQSSCCLQCSRTSAQGSAGCSQSQIQSSCVQGLQMMLQSVCWGCSTKTLLTRGHSCSWDAACLSGSAPGM